MKHLYTTFRFVLFFIILLAANSLHAQFTAGNLAILQADASANNTTCSVIQINTTTAAQPAITTTVISGTGASALRISGSATSTGYVSRSSDKSLLTFTGANNTNTASNVNTLNPRAVATLNAAQTFGIATTYTGGSGDQTRGATSINNTNWFIADQGGLFTNSATSASPTGNFRSIKPFGGTVYVSSASSTATVIQVSTISAPSGGTLAGLPGLTNNASLQDFYMISSGTNGNTFDILYVLSATSNTVGSIAKYSLVLGTWTANGSYATTFGGFGLASEKNGGGANLYVTTGQGALTANSVIKLNDAAGYNAAINITTGSNVTLYTAATGKIMKGIDFAPVAPALPTVNLSVSSNTASETSPAAITVTATASAPVAGNQTVDLAVSGTNITAGDYSLSATTITIPAGATTGSVTFTVVDDILVEGNETAVLTISNPSSGITLGATTTQNIDIADNDAATPAVDLSVSTNAGTEAGMTSVTVTATSSAAVSGNQSVTLGVSGTGIAAGDYVLSATTITILNGQTTGTVTFKIRNDAETEGTETAVLAISNPSSGIILGTVTTQNISITDNTCQPFIRKSTATSANGAEISAFDSSTKRIFTVAGPAIEYYSLSNTGILAGPSNMAFGFSPPAGANAVPNSVAVKNGIVAVSYAIVDAVTNAQQPGVVAFYQPSTASYIHHVTVGYLPDMITFTPAGTKLLTANEGEPNSYGQGTSFDPEGSVSIIDISGGVNSATVQTAGFASFNSQMAALKAAGVRIFGPGATVAQDLEPEYIALSADATKAYVTLQENNAVAEVDIATASVTQILPLGLKNYNLAGNGLDASDQDGGINIRNWPMYGMYMPDAISAFTVGGITYYITANEGDSRAYTGYSEEIRVGAGGYVLDPTVFPNAATLKQNINLGRLQLTNASGDTDNDGDFDEIHAFGARSFTIWNSAFTKVYDCGDQLEQISAAQNPLSFNSEGTTATFDTRSDNKGPEPEAATTGTINGVLYAFIGTERTGDIYVYDVSNPAAPVFKQYIDNPADLGVEGLIFIPAAQSPTGKALLVSSAEVSKTVTVYEFSLVTGSLSTVNTAIAATQGTTTSYGDCAGLIAKLDQGGAAPVTGTVDAKVWIESSVPVENSVPYVQRHYELTPAIAAATSTGSVTLYFTQTEFDNFNNHAASILDLPANAGDAIGIGNLRVIKYPGTSSDGSGLPSTYTGTPVVIDPDDARIVWNAADARWEVTFDVTGFSGFVVTTSVSVLPVTLIDFAAGAQNDNTLVRWSANESGHGSYNVQYSIDGRSFITAGNVPAQTGSGNRQYTYTHVNAAALGNKLYYRLQMNLLNSQAMYSNTVLVRFGGREMQVTDVYPNPAKTTVYITAGIPAGKSISIKIADMKGRTLLTQQLAGNGSHSVNISDLPTGIYILEALLPDGSRQQFRLLKN